MAKIFVLEDMNDSFALIRGALGPEHNITRSISVESAKQQFEDGVDLAIVDVGLPDGNGFEFCDWIRMEKKNEEVPIIFLTAKQTLDSRVTAFTVGGDDFIPKPFNVLELRARVESKLKRMKARSSNTIEKCGVQLNYREQMVRLKREDGYIPLDLTPIEFKILSILILNPEKAFSRDEILNEVWGEQIYVYPRSVDTHVSKLRKKLGEKSSLIRSVHGYGYKFSPKIAEKENVVLRQSI